MVDTQPAAAATGAPLPDRAVVPPVWGRITNLTVDHGEGSWLVTMDGERYLDYTSGIGVTNTGHAHPRVVAAVQAQAAKLLHGQQNIVYHEPGLRLYDRLAHLLPGGPWSAFLSNSGAEAVEAAVKLARVATGRPAIIAFRYGFHGRTAQTMALTAAKDVYRGAFEPLPGAVYHAAYPYCYRAPGGPHDPAACTCDWEAQLDLLFHQLVYPDKVAAIIVEPVIGEGGYIVPPPGFLPRLREITRGTASCSSPTRSRRASPGPARSSPCATGTWSRTSWSWPRASRPGCRSRGFSPGSRHHGPLPARLPRRHVRRQRGRLRRGHGHPRRDRG